MGLDVDLRGPPALSLMAVCAVATMALAVAMGIGRFAFTPLLPLMVRDGTLGPGAGAWMAASNYLGYLVGALSMSRLPLSLPALMRASLAGTVLATAAMGAVDGTAAWGSLRFLAGVFSAWAMVSTSAWTLQRLSQVGRADLSGPVFAGVGLGIAIVGVFCLAAARPGASAARLWLELGALTALLVAAPYVVLARSPGASAALPLRASAAGTSDRRAGIVICYGVLGLGYILPATFLPTLAREVVDDPQVFGLAWPLFGIAAAVSTIATAKRARGAVNRLRFWAATHLLMATGVALPVLWLAPATIAFAALSVGGTFMVATMLGLQEARERASDNPTGLLSKMTAAFATGQLAGPVVSGILEVLPGGHLAALGHALGITASALALSAAYLWWHARGRVGEGARAG
jgi:hypothetical protein